MRPRRVVGRRGRERVTEVEGIAAAGAARRRRHDVPRPRTDLFSTNGRPLAHRAAVEIPATGCRTAATGLAGAGRLADVVYASVDRTCVAVRAVDVLVAGQGPIERVCGPADDA